MQYISTRGDAPELSFSDANLAGLARDNGLYVPRYIPRFSLETINAMRDVRYQDIVKAVARQYIDRTDISYAELGQLIETAYRKEAWDDPRIAPVVTIAPDVHILELFHGPTLAFKDLAMQPVGQIVRFDLKRKGRRMTIAVATSGDTGSAGAEAFRGAPEVDYFVLFPDNGTSAFQRKQMTTLEEKNIHAMAIKDAFDPIQAIVKKLFEEPFRTQFNIGGVNSIAWGRILFQIPYYFEAYRRVAQYVGEVVTFVVPTGNMGDIYAGWVAREMGLPIELVLATNSNHVLVDLFETGVYEPWHRDDLVLTTSPSMDIQRASNWERLLYYICRHDPRLVAALMDELARTGKFALDREQCERLWKCGIRAGWASERECRSRMQYVYNTYNYLADSHTSIGLEVGMQMKLKGPVVYLATASPVKFDEAILAAKLPSAKRPPRFVGIEARPEQQVITLPADVELVKKHIVAVLGAG